MKRPDRQRLPSCDPGSTPAGNFFDIVAISILLDDWQKLKRKRSWDYSKADRPKARAKGTGFRKD